MSNADRVPSLRTSDRIYRALLNIYPVGYRQKYGPLMAQVFRDLCRDAYHRRGILELASLWMHTLADVATTATAQHVDVLLNGTPPPDFPPAAVEFYSVYKGFETRSGEVRMTLKGINLTVQPGEFVAVVGPTGCGKSTMLSLIAGLEKPNRGRVSVMGNPVHNISQRVGYIFQSDALFPWKTVLDNILAGPLFRGVSHKEALGHAHDWIKRVGLAGFEHYYPAQLSGGMRKRVALAQSLIIQPNVLLMDEPFSDLDAQTRILMEDELLDLWASTKASIMFITHDLEEAIALADRVVVLTVGPAMIKGVYLVDIPRPRHVAEIRFNHRFAELHKEIWEDLRSEVSKNYGFIKQHEIRNSRYF